ncbi:hypothetical protein CC78DRAFT_615618 [Lojkania enalia]|uniref:Uncharacterized protein n=1 Tax=Lojkania enalia TaxID=147567 RepID=A0A9P4KBZ5_9PLEO|nr:hypothetical protein CC78DRAFT_615618 [Didymosphaeria enalia]
MPMDSLKHTLKKVFHTSQPNSQKNPYINPHHPNHNPAPAPPTTTTATAFRPRSPARPSASPRGSSDFLAEAREAVGRDRITGRRLVHSTPSPGPRSHSLPPGQIISRGRTLQTDQDPFADPQAEEGETSTFSMRNQGVRAKSGTRYDLFVREMKERREGAVREPTGGYYAPKPRQLTEFYALRRQ